jgi:hypothetical protein
MKRSQAHAAARSALVAAIAAAWLGGCASSPSLSQTGDLATTFAPGSTYRIATVPEVRNADLESRLEQHLGARGLTVAGEAPPTLLLEVSTSGRPIDVGAYGTPAPPSPRAPEDAWLAAPRPRHWWTARGAGLCVIDVRASDPATGRELYRLRAEARRRRGDCLTIQHRLLDRAISGAISEAALRGQPG